MRVLIVPNVQNPSAMTASAELVAWLAGIGADVVMTHGDAEASGLGRVGVQPSEIGEPRLAVALGGDGTILKAFHALGEAETPILGVKFGRLGFLSGSSSEEMRTSIESALAGDAAIERRATLKAEIVMDGRITGTYRAMNEIVASRGPSGRVVVLEVFIGGKRIAEHRADGVIVATATGSTAYALSAGGPIVAPGHGGMIVVPVASHTLQSRPVITGPSDVVELALSDPARGEACLVVDGETAPCRQSLQRIIVRRGEHDVALVKCSGRDFYETVAEEFFGG